MGDGHVVRLRRRPGGVSWSTRRRFNGTVVGETNPLQPAEKLRDRRDAAALGRIGQWVADVQLAVAPVQHVSFVGAQAADATQDAQRCQATRPTKGSRQGHILIIIADIPVRCDYKNLADQRTVAS